MNNNSTNELDSTTKSSSSSNPSSTTQSTKKQPTPRTYNFGNTTRELSSIVEQCNHNLIKKGSAYVYPITENDYVVFTQNKHSSQEMEQHRIEMEVAAVVNKMVYKTALNYAIEMNKGLLGELEVSGFC